MDEDLPPELRIGQFDAVIIYGSHPRDAQLAEYFKCLLERFIPVTGGEKPEICLYSSGNDFGGQLCCINNRFDQLQEAIERSTYIFLLFTENSEEEWFKLARDASLSECLSNPSKKYCLCPLYESKSTKPPKLFQHLQSAYICECFKKYDEAKTMRIEDVEEVYVKINKVKIFKNLFESRRNLKSDRQAQDQLKIAEYRQRARTENDATSEFNEREPQTPMQQTQNKQWSVGGNFVSQPLVQQPNESQNYPPIGQSTSESPDINPRAKNRGDLSGDCTEPEHKKPSFSQPEILERTGPDRGITEREISTTDANRSDETEPKHRPSLSGSFSQLEILERQTGPDRSITERKIHTTDANRRAMSGTQLGTDSSPERETSTTFEAEQQQQNLVTTAGSIRGPVHLGSKDSDGITRSKGRELGKGTSSTVYEGKLGTIPVALKIFKIDFMRHYEKEKNVAFLRHPYILPVLGYGIEHSLLVLPLKSHSLGDVLRRKVPLVWGDQWSTWLRILFQVSVAVDYLHTPTSNKGAIRHGDVKPDNILLDAQGNACLCDHGLAQELPPDRQDMTNTGSQSGTHHYQDPCVTDYDRRAPVDDIYSLGVVLVQMLTHTIGGKYDEILNAGGLRKENIIYYLVEIWKEGTPSQVTDALVELTQLACKPRDRRIFMNQFCARLHELITTQNVEPYLQSANAPCCMCHFYPTEGDSWCYCASSRFCSGCLSHDSVNPLSCPNCCVVVPQIGGSHVFALLISGTQDKTIYNFTEDIFASDVQRLYNVLVDPRIGNIRQGNVTRLFSEELSCREYGEGSQSEATPENVIAQLQHIATKARQLPAIPRPQLILVVSCHAKSATENAAKDGAWQLHGGELEHETLGKQLREMLTSLDVMLIADYCFAGKPIPVITQAADSGASFIQWSPCIAQSQAHFTSNGSLFINCLLAGLRSASRKHGDLDDSTVCPAKRRECEHCRKFRERAARDKCVSFVILKDFVDSHIVKMLPTHPKTRLVAATDKQDFKLTFYNDRMKTTQVWYYPGAEGNPEQLVLKHTLQEYRSVEQVISGVAACVREIFGVLPKDFNRRLRFIKHNYRGEATTVEDLQELRELHDRFELLECRLDPQPTPPSPRTDSVSAHGRRHQNYEQNTERKRSEASNHTEGTAYSQTGILRNFNNQAGVSNCDASTNRSNQVFVSEQSPRGDRSSHVYYPSSPVNDHTSRRDQPSHVYNPPTPANDHTPRRNHDNVRTTSNPNVGPLVLPLINQVHGHFETSGDQVQHTQSPAIVQPTSS